MKRTKNGGVILPKEWAEMPTREFLQLMNVHGLNVYMRSDEYPIEDAFEILYEAMGNARERPRSGVGNKKAKRGKPGTGKKGPKTRRGSRKPF